MVQMENITLKNILENLDDARKYQSLRDILRDIPAVDLAAVAVLTAYIPMLTDAGGNAGSQSTSTIICGMAVGNIAPKDLPRILWRECRAALLCGGTLAVCNFAKLMLLDRVGFGVSLVVCGTLVCTVLLSQLIGGILPVIAKKLKMDPAVMASPLITTIVDTTTLLIYFNIAKMVLHL